jgi:hypothetical protein
MARGEKAEMLKLLRQLLLAIAMLGVVSAGAFAQRKDTNDRKDPRPPRQNTTQQPPKDNRRRPD